MRADKNEQGLAGNYFSFLISEGPRLSAAEIFDLIQDRYFSRKTPM